jgi:hypothetical protein
MNSTTAWWQFWQASFAIAGGSFAVIAGIVAVRGVGDLRRLVQFLENESKNPAGTNQD